MKLEKALTMLCLYRKDNKYPTGVASGEHIALTLTTNGSHILLDLGKSITSLYLAPGDKGDSIAMLRNDIDAEYAQWTFKNINGVINVNVIVY